jgi:putative ubiquitin-RnfH superfamily antitoxin RatB of RatAB toxin-antitoxin module
MIAVEVVFCPAQGACDLVSLHLQPGATLAEALQLSGLLQRYGLPGEGLATGVWGRRQPADRVLREGDRVEIYRPLCVDPKEARRLRYRAGQGQGKGQGKRPRAAG